MGVTIHHCTAQSVPYPVPTEDCPPAHAHSRTTGGWMCEKLQSFMFTGNCTGYIITFSDGHVCCFINRFAAS